MLEKQSKQNWEPIARTDGSRLCRDFFRYVFCHLKVSSFTCYWLNAATFSTLTNTTTMLHNFVATSFRSYFSLTVTRKNKSFLDMDQARKKLEKTKLWSIHLTTTVHSEDEQRFSKAYEIRTFHAFDTVVSQMDPLNFWLEMFSLFSD